MTNFTIEQLEALKEGTTPGPWRSISSNTIWSRIDPDVLIPQYSRRLNVVIETTSGGDYAATKDVFLMAAAPALVDESIGDKRALIAEKRAHQKLRAEIEAVLDVVKHETWLHDDEGQFPETVQLGSYVAGQLARILEADNE